MNVTPISPLAASFGWWIRPVRGVTAERRTRLPNCRARLRRARFFSVLFNIWPGRTGESDAFPRSPTVSQRSAKRNAALVHSRTNARGITLTLVAGVSSNHCLAINTFRESQDACCLFGIGNHGTADGGQPGQGRS